MDKIKKFIDCYIPTETCNFRCHYCYITQKRKFNNKIAKFDYSPEYIRKAFSKERLGGTCMFNLCAGGETLISEEVIPIIKELLEEGHYVMVVTNGSLSNRFKEISKFDKRLLNHLFFKFSFHFLELKKRNLLNIYFDNVNLMRESGASFTIEITPNDELEPYINEIKEICIEKVGALPHITIGREDNADIIPLTKHDFEDYKNIWKTFDSEMFNYKSQIFGEKRKEFCYAGDWSIYVNLKTGNYKQCYKGLQIGNIYKNIDKPIKTLAIGNCCNEPHCYNGHAYLTFGNIPELDSPTYDLIRNRTSKNGDWLNEDMKTFMQTKLVESNSIYRLSKKSVTNIKNMPFFTLQTTKNKLKSVLKK